MSYNSKTWVGQFICTVLKPVCVAVGPHVHAAVFTCYPAHTAPNTCSCGIRCRAVEPYYFLGCASRRPSDTCLATRYLPLSVSSWDWLQQRALVSWERLTKVKGILLVWDPTRGYWPRQHTSWDYKEAQTSTTVSWWYRGVERSQSK